MPSATEHRGAFVERNKAGVQDYAAKKRAAIERANQIREQRKNQRDEGVGQDALDAHIQGTPTAKSREPTQTSSYDNHGDMRHENHHTDALDALGGLVNTTASSHGVNGDDDYNHHYDNGSDALDGLMRGRDGGSRGHDVTYDEGRRGRGFREEPR